MPRLLLLSFIALFNSSLLFAEGERQRILSARFPWTNMWRLSNDIEAWKESGEADPAVYKKLLKILTWTRSSIFVSSNIHMRRVKRAAADVLLTSAPPSESETTQLARSLDKATLSRSEHHDAGDFSFIAEVLVEWARQGDSNALEEIVKAVESNSATKVFETELALATSYEKDPEWIQENEAAFNRIKKALGRPWVFVLLRYVYEKDLRFSQHSEKQFYLALERPYTLPLSTAELAQHLSTQDNSMFHFVLTLEEITNNPKILEDRIAAAQLIANNLEAAINNMPQLKDNVFFAYLVMRSIEVFSLHNPFIDNLLAHWIDAKFSPHTYVVQAPKNCEINLIKEIRKNAFAQLIHIQERFHYAETVERASKFPPDVKRQIGYAFFPALHPNPTPVDQRALKKALECKSCPTAKKLELIDHHMMEDPYIQSMVLSFVRDPEVQMSALEHLNMSKNLGVSRLTELAAIIGISAPEEVEFYLSRYSNLMEQFKRLPRGKGLGQSCRAKIKRYLRI